MTEHEIPTVLATPAEGVRARRHYNVTFALLAGAADLHIGRVEQPVEASAGPDPPEATGAIGAIRDAGGP